MRTTCAVLWALSLLTALALPARAQAADSAEQVIIDFRLGHLDARTVPAYRVGDRALVPLTPLLEMAEVRFTLSPEGRLDGVVQPGDVRLLVDARADTMRYGARRVAAAAAERISADGELYVESRVLGTLLGVTFAVHWEDLAVTLEDPNGLPVARRIRREAQRSAFLARRDRERAMAAAPIALARPALDGLVLDYSLTVPGSRPLRDAGYTAALGVDVLGGSLEGSVYGSAGGRALAQGSWTGVWRDNPWLRQLRLGDGIATGPVARLQRGVSLTNSPYVRPSRFGTLAFPGMLPAGWQLEAYRGGALVALDSADAAGRFAVSLPVDYGDNAVEFVAYGPYGEERPFARSYRVLGELLPARQIEYGLSAGQCAGGPLAGCRTSTNLDLRYGLTGRWTARVGADRFWRDSLGARPGGTLTHPYASLVGRVNQSVALQAERVGGALTRGGVRYEPSLDLRLSADHTRYDRGPKLALLGPAGWRSRTVLGGFFRPFGVQSLFFVEGSAERIETSVGTVTSTRLGTSINSYGVRYMPYTRVERVNPGLTRSLVGVNTFIFPPRWWGSLLSSTLVRAGAEMAQDGRLASATAALTRQLPRGLQAEAGALWSRGSRGPVLTLGLSANRASYRAQSSLVAAAGAPASATQYVQGSVLWNRATDELSLTAGPSLQRAGIAGRVYLDANANGRFDAGEQVIPDAFVRVGHAGDLADSAGVFRVWDVVPFEPVALQVDSLSLPSPLWVPATVAATVSLAPNRYLPLDVAIVAGGTVEGRVVQAVGGQRSGVGGVRLTLRELAAGGGRRAVTTFSDGEFSDMPLRPGEYEAAVDSAVLRRLGATADPVRFTVRATPDGDQVTGVELLLVPSPAPSDSAVADSAPAPAPAPDSAAAAAGADLPPPAVADSLTSAAAAAAAAVEAPRLLPTLRSAEARERGRHSHPVRRGLGAPALRD